MTDRDLMQQALDAMRDAAFDEEGYIMNADLAEAHDALRNRLAHCDRCGKRLGGEGDIHTCTPDPIGDAQDRLIAEMAAQPEQEPVAIGWDTKTDTPIMGYSTPPAAAQRQWVGLTDEEIEGAVLGWHSTEFSELEDEPSLIDIGRAIEAKLKEKNNG